MDYTGGSERDASELMPPPAPRPPKRGREVVLEEEEWVAKMEGIIERDFFPELGKLQDKVAWLEAVRSGDPEVIRRAQIQIAQRQQSQIPGGATPGFTAGRGRTNLRGGLIPGEAGFISADASNYHPSGVAIPQVSLDKFLAHHTSEDNESFKNILERTNKRRRGRAAALLIPSNDPKLLITDGREKTDGFGTTGQPTDTQAGWKYNPINLLMYDGATKISLALSKREISSMMEGPPKAINHSATRLHRPVPQYPLGSQTPSTSIDTASTAITSEDGDGTGVAFSGGGPTAGTAAAAAAAGGKYDILATPSFDPGVEASPFITWGEIEATPVRIEAEDLPSGALQPGGRMGSAPFRIQQTPKREQKAHELASKAGAAMRKRPHAGGITPARAAAMTALGRTPKNGSAGGKTPLSHAAQRLVGRMKKAGNGGDRGDAALRASYRGTPGRGGNTPLHSGWESVGGTPSRGSNWTPRPQ